jgi:glucose/arabinose dehydrogenase
MRRGLTAILAAGLLLGGAVPARAAVAAQPILGGLDFPAAFTFAPGGRIFYAERFNGQIRIYNPATGRDRLFHTIPNVATSGEQGLLGLALHPQYPARPFVFAYYTHPSDENRIVRMRDQEGVGVDRRIILVVPANGNHNGGVIHFGPDGRLYAVVGDSGNAANSQNLDSRAGKVLRMTALGRVPADNPIEGNYTYSYGHRNMFGFAFDPLTGDPWISENGPHCNDEINHSLPGENYAWGPNWSCEGASPGNTNQDGPEPRQMPESHYGPPMLVPTGVAFCDGCGLTGHRGHLVFGSWGGGGLLRSLALDAEREDVTSESILYDHSSGILAVERAPNGRLYFSDSDQIFRLVQT